MLDLSDAPKTFQQYKREHEKKKTKMLRILGFWPKKELQAYVYDNHKHSKSTDAGMSAILERFIYTDRFNIGTMSEELKMAFDIVLSISRNKKIYFETTDLILEFIQAYKEVIYSYDRQSAQTYHYKLMQGYERSVMMVNRKLEIEQEMRIKY